MIISLAIRERESSAEDEARSYIMKVEKVPNQDELFRGQILDETSQVIFETDVIEFLACLNVIAAGIEDLGVVINASNISIR